jgi:hypothetical protein
LKGKVTRKAKGRRENGKKIVIKDTDVEGKRIKLSFLQQMKFRIP